MPKVYVSQLAAGDLAIYEGKAFKVSTSQDRTTLTRIDPPSGIVEQYNFSPNSQILVETPTQEEARQRAEIYWTGYLKAILNRTPKIIEIERKVDETWKQFYGPHDMIVRKLRE